jgi:hypothetical protein
MAEGAAFTEVAAEAFTVAEASVVDSTEVAADFMAAVSVEAGGRMVAAGIAADLRRAASADRPTAEDSARVRTEHRADPDSVADHFPAMAAASAVRADSVVRAALSERTAPSRMADGIPSATAVAE